MASIKQRGNSFQVQVRRKDSPNISKCFKSLSEAKAWARQIESAIDNGNSSFAKVRNSNIPTLYAALQRYEREILPTKKSATKEHSFLNRWKQHRIASKVLSNITSQDIASCRDELLRCGLAKASVVRHLATVSHLYTIAIKEWGYSLNNPVLRIRKPKVANARSRRPTQEELEAVLAHLPSGELRTFVQLATETAMRRSELIGLNWHQVNLEKRLVYLPDSKNGCSRTVVISTLAAAHFMTLKAPQNSSGRVFSFTHTDTPSKAFRRALILSRAKYEQQCIGANIGPDPSYLCDLRLHDLRHEATSSMFERGLSLMEVASITGHKTMAMLQRYTHLSSQHLQAKLG